MINTLEKKIVKQKLFSKKTLAASVILLSSATASAQVSENSSAAASATTQVAVSSQNSSNTNTKIERVEVIGTRIKKIAKEGSTAVKNVNKESMKNSANTTASDSMRDSTLAVYGVSRESSGGSAAATATIGLRGLGAQRTLVLLNGHRLPNDPSWEAVDLNLIPQSAIERIEVLKDGASALYGSDAIGGVINIVTKKGSAGNEVAAKFSTNNKKGGNVYDISGVTGFVNNNVDFLMAMNYSHSDKVYGKDRDLTKDGLSATGKTAAWKGVGQTSWTLANPSECPDDLKVTNSSGTRCYFRYNELASIQPEINQFNLLTDTTFRLDSGIKLYNRNLIVNKDIHWNYAPTPAALSLDSGTASNSNARTVSIRMMDAGNRENHDTEINFNSVVGVKGSLTDNLEYDVSTSYGEINRKNRGTSGYLNENTVLDLISTGSYDPLQTEGNRGDLSSAQAQTYQNQKSRLFTVEGLVTGDIAELNGESIGMATGVSYLTDKLVNNSDDASAEGVILGGAGSSDHGGRIVQSIFSEVSVPLMPKLELDGALRFDHYSDFGNTLNPKLSAKYQLNDWMIVRASAGTGFKAPTLSQLYGSASNGYVTFIDRKMCATNSDYCTASQYLIEGGGNANLKEEKAIAYSLGTVIQPQSNLLISIDGWYTKVNNLVDINYEDLTEAEKNGVNVSEHGVTVNRDADTGEITSIEAKNLNLASDELAGIDFLTDLQLPGSFGPYGLSLVNDFSYMLFDKYEGFPGAGKRNTIGEWGKPQWRNTFTVSAKSDLTTVSVGLRTIPGQNFVDKDIKKKISNLNEIDLSATHKLTAKSQISAGIKNLFDTAQPADVGAGTGGATEVNTSLYDVNGRKVFVSYSEKF